MRKSILYSTLLLAALAVLTGCETLSDAWDEAMKPSTSSWGEKYKPRYVLGFFQIVKNPRAGDLEAEISTFDGRKIWINTNQFLSSKNIKEIKALPRVDRPDCFDIALNLDDRGCLIWSSLAAEFREKPIVLMADNFFQCTFIPQPLGAVDETWVVIHYPFDEVTAKGMEKFGKTNYKHFNPSPTSLF